MADFDIPSPDEENWDKLEREINFAFDQLIEQLNGRRIVMLNKISDLRVKKNHVYRSMKQIETTKVLLQDQLKENLVNDIQDQTINRLNRKLSSLIFQSTVEENFNFFCDTKDFDFVLSKLGAIEKPASEYLAKNQPKYLFPKLKNVSGLSRISVNEDFGLVCASDRRGKQIFIFSLTGELLNCLKHDRMKCPVSLILISFKEIIISDLSTNSVYKIQFDMHKQYKCKIIGTRNNVSYITAMDYDIERDHIYTASILMCSLEILDRKSLTTAGKVDHLFLYPRNVIVRKTEIYVLDCDNPCIHVLSKSTHQLLRSVLSQGADLNFSHPLAFSVDNDGRIIIANYHGTENSIQIYSPNGHLLHSFPNDGSRILEPCSIHVTRNYDVIIVLKDSTHCIQVF